MRKAIAVCVVVMLSACAAVQDKSPDSLYKLGDRLARTVCAESAPSIQPVKNLHVEGQIDQLETRRCTSGSSTLYKGKTTSNPEGLPVAVEILAPQSGLPAHLEIGQPVDQAVKVLGAPQEQTQKSLTYGLGMQGRAMLTLNHQSGLINSVRWTWAMD